MNPSIQPWQLLLVSLAGWINRQQQDVIEYLRTENQILKEAHGNKRIPLTDAQRSRLAVKGKMLGRKLLEEIGTLVTPDTILRWHRLLIARESGDIERHKKVGRPPVAQEIVELVIRFARENPSWGYDRIQGALANLGHKVSDQSVGNILKEHGIEPVPKRCRQTTWKAFIKAHWDVLAAIDFTTIEVWSKGGLITFYLLFVMELKTRRVHFAGCSVNPDGAWMRPCAENLVGPHGDILKGKRYLIMDRDTKFTEGFCNTLERAGVESIPLPPRSPNLNAHLERFMRSLKEECLQQMIFFGEASLRLAVAHYLEHYHKERNHQGLGNGLIEPAPIVEDAAGDVICQERLGGLLKYYYRAAA